MNITKKRGRPKNHAKDKKYLVNFLMYSKDVQFLKGYSAKKKVSLSSVLREIVKSWVIDNQV